MSKFTISLYHDTRSKKLNNTYPVKIRVYSNATTRFYPTGIDISAEDFKSTMAVKPTGNVTYYKKDKAVVVQAKELKNTLDGLKTSAVNKANEIRKFNFQEFGTLMGLPNGSTADAFYHFTVMAEALKKDDRVKSAKCYLNSMKSLRDFLESTNRKTESLPFAEINVGFLKEYEKWMLTCDRPMRRNGVIVKKRGKVVTKGPSQKTTVGFYMRALRAIFNRAGIPKEDYPFGNSPKYVIPTGRSVKKALSKEDIIKLKDYPVQDEYIFKARDYFLFSYLTNGINIKDIAGLRYKNIDGEFIFFEREKTKNTTRDNPILIHAPLHPYAKEIIERRGNQNTQPGNYIFPILNDRMTPVDKEKAVDNHTRFVNQHLKRLAKMIGIDPNISSYYARHSFTTISVHQNGASLEFIKEALGHHSVETTKNYLGSFPNASKQLLSSKLI